MKQYSKCKDSKISWLGKVPEHWKVKKLKYLLRNKITDGPHETPEFIDNGIPFLSVDSIQDGKIIFEGCRFISKAAYDLYKKKVVVERNDILMGKAASIGKIAKVNEDIEFSVWSPLAVIKCSENIIDPSFLEYSLKSPESQYQIEILCTSNTQKNISMDDIPRIILTLPDMTEQKIIVRFLNNLSQKIDFLIEKRKKMIELLYEERVVIINNAVTKGINPNVKMKDSGVEWLGQIPGGWDVKRLKYVAKIQPSNVDKKPIEGEKQIKLCNYTDVYKNENITSKINFMVSTAKDEEIKKFKLKKGDVIITKDSETPDDIAVPSLVKENFDDVICGYHLALIRPQEEIIGEYLHRIFQIKKFNDRMCISANGVTRFAIGVGDISNLVVLLPPISEQQQIIKHIETETSKIDRTLSQFEQEIALLQEYKTALISEAVTGKIDVREEVQYA